MRAGNTYRHTSTLDTDFYIHSVKYSSANYIRVKASIVDRKGKYIYQTATFRIYREHFINWRIV